MRKGGLMKVVILAGGFGTRISEESHLIPKPMIEIGEKPILWHIMKYYSSFGFNEFVILAGYKQYVIKEFFSDYYLHMSDITFDFSNGKNSMDIHFNQSEPWKVTIVNTGLNTMTGGRLKRVQKYIGNESFFLTYGDGVSNVNISDLLEFHKESKAIATLTAIQPGGRFGLLEIDEHNLITSFKEKSIEEGGWVNGGFMVLEKEVFDYLIDDDTVLEKDPLMTLASQGKLSSFKHNGFWQCMDTLRDKEYLEKMWKSGDAPWKNWI